MDTVISVSELCYAYPNSETTMTDVSFSISRGESVGLIGSNGAGKSTLFSLMCGLLKPQNGSIEICGKQLGNKALSYVRTKLGVVFQNPDEQLFSATVYDDVAFGPGNMGLGKDEISEAVKQALEKMDIAHLADRAPYKLSDGEKRKAAIAAVLSMNPEILLFDEPTATLDPRARRLLIATLNTLKQTKIIASHDLDMILSTCETVLFLNKGRLVASGSCGEILSNKQLLEDNGLELPLSLS